METSRLGVVFARAWRVAGSLALLAALALGVAALPAVQAAATHLSRAPSAAAGLSARDWAQLAELLTPNPGQEDLLFGHSVAIVGDTMVVGAPCRNVDGEARAGATYVFERGEGSWTQQAELSLDAGAAAGDLFGDSVAISGDTVVVGAPCRNVDGKPRAGAAYVYERSGGSWTQQAELSLGAAASAGDMFGDSVAISGDTVVVGAAWRDVDGTADAGAAYVFERSGGSWSAPLELSLGAAAADNDMYGVSVAISPDTVVVGALRRDVGGTADAGAAYVYERSGGSWTQQAELSLGTTAASNDMYGVAVAVSGDTVVVGAQYRDVGSTVDAGAAYVYERSGGSWSQQAELGLGTAAAAGDPFGDSVAISGDTVVVGAQWRDVGATADAGAAYVYERSGGSWTQQAEFSLGAGAATNDMYGVSVAVSGDTVVVGAQFHDMGGMANAGAAYVYEMSALPSATP